MRCPYPCSHYLMANKSRRKPCISSATCCGELLVKYSSCAECEIIHSVNCEISHFVRCEMKFAFSHLRSKYFTAELFHMAEPYFTRRRRISLKKAHIVYQDNVCFFLARDLTLLRCPKFAACLRSPNFDRCHSFFLASSAPGGARKRPSRLLLRKRRSPDLDFDKNKAYPCWDMPYFWRRRRDLNSRAGITGLHP